MSSAAQTRGSELSLALTAQERTELLLYLEQALRDTLVEVHRTESPDYRQRVQHRESALRKVLDALRQP